MAFRRLITSIRKIGQHIIRLRGFLKSRHIIAIFVIAVIIYDIVFAQAVALPIRLPNGVTLTVVLPKFEYLTSAVFIYSAFLAYIVFPLYRLWRENTEVNLELPSAVRVISDSLRTGLTLMDSIPLLQRVGKGRIAAILTRGLAYEITGQGTLRDYITEVAKRLRNENLAIFATILDVVMRRGARVAESLDMAYKTFETVMVYEAEKNTQLKPYMALIYTAMLIYVIISGIITYMLLPSLAGLLKTPMTGIGIIPKLVSFPLRIDAVISLMELAIVLQSLIAGLIIGRIVQGRAVTGLLHSAILTALLTLINYLMYCFLYVKSFTLPLIPIWPIMQIFGLKKIIHV